MSWSFTYNDVSMGAGRIPQLTENRAKREQNVEVYGEYSQRSTELTDLQLI
jgi:hypothetical protein